MRERYGRIDVLFNNAGISPGDDGSVLETARGVGARPAGQPAQRLSVLQARHPAPARERGPARGSVINTASFVAVMGAATSQISYTASKGGVLALSRELGVEFARRGVRVNALCPGPVDTPLLQELFAKDPERAARRLVHVPMGRFARAEEIAQGALFLAGGGVELHDRVDVPHRRRPQRRLHDAAAIGLPSATAGRRVPSRETIPRRLPSHNPGGERPWPGVYDVSPAGARGEPRIHPRPVPRPEERLRDRCLPHAR